ncbi:MAG: lipoyl(octanoyl) transferase LipB [Bacteroidota bacterium]|nr:lipoyl(octanoyl) transferase LipB [Bacteroidota bacterium]
MSSTRILSATAAASPIHPLKAGSTCALISPTNLAPTNPKAAFGCPLGRVPYGPAWDLQRTLKDRLLTARRNRELLPHFVLLVEHLPVYTMGKSGQAQHLLLNADRRVDQGIEYFEIGRGGDITYHGPGQLVVYFLLDLNRFYRDLHRFMRDLEEIVIRTLASWGIAGYRVSGRTGVWVGPAGHEKKICAFGIRCSRWVTMHGLALNINTNLAYFDHIIPCGISDRGVTSFQTELNFRCDLAAVSRVLCSHFAHVFGADMELLDEPDAYDVLESVTDVPDLGNTLQSQPFS